MISFYNIMTIKSSQTLVSEALKVVKTITPEEALELCNNNNCNLVKKGRVGYEKLQDGKFNRVIRESKK